MISITSACNVNICHYYWKYSKKSDVKDTSFKPVSSLMLKYRKVQISIVTLRPADISKIYRMFSVALGCNQTKAGSQTALDENIQ